MVLPRLRQAFLQAVRPAARRQTPSPAACLPARRLAASIAHADRPPELAGLVATYQALCERIDGFASRRPDVAGVSLLRQRACRDLKFVQGLDGVAGVELRSAANNAVGMNAELDVVRAPCEPAFPAAAALAWCVGRLCALLSQTVSAALLAQRHRASARQAAPRAPG